MNEPATPDTQPASAHAKVESAHDQRGWVGGVILIALGVLFLAVQVVPDLGRYVVLTVGLALFVIFLVSRSYGVLVPAGIVSGVGVGIVLTSQGGVSGGSAFLLSLAAGFISIWVIAALFRLPENHAWPWIPGGILGLIGISQVLREQGYNVGELVSRGWPVILIVIGMIVVVRAVSRRT